MCWKHNMLCCSATGSREYVVRVAGMPFRRFLLPLPRFSLEGKDLFFGKHFLTKSTSLLLLKPAISHVCGNEKRLTWKRAPTTEYKAQQRDVAPTSEHIFFVSICCISVNEWKWVVHDAASDDKGWSLSAVVITRRHSFGDNTPEHFLCVSRIAGCHRPLGGELELSLATPCGVSRVVSWRCCALE